MFDHVSFLKTVPDLPGVYRMYNGQGTVIYVGKAKNLSNRLHSYFVANLSSPKTRALVNAIHHIEFTVTLSESDALLLEQNLIKEHRPRYNILLRDDKSYPYILISADKYPRICSHRGPQNIPGTYFGPYPNSSAVKESLKILRSIFPIRQCTNAVFANRTRPCLLYQVKKCSGPCVSGLISDREYEEAVHLTSLFLKGRYGELLSQLTGEMSKASEECRFEQAAVIRDRIFALRKVQEQQIIDFDNKPDADIIACDFRSGMVGVNIIYYRHGQLLGSRNTVFSGMLEEDEPDLICSFLEQYYTSQPAFGIPAQIVLEESSRQEEDFSEMLSAALGQKIVLSYPTRGIMQKLLGMSRTNATTALSSKLRSAELQTERICDLERLFSLAAQSISRMECFDISHTFGERTVASCVVFGRNGPENSQYRLFNITGITAGDDFAAMKQALERRFLKADSAARFPDILFIDGGDGQLGQAEEVITKAREKFPEYNPLLVGVSKGEGRKHGLETLHLGYSRQELHLPMDSPAFLLIQHIRDESHRFAITNHRKQRSAHKIRSKLQDIPGIGPKKRQALLNRFGGLAEIISASREEIAKTEGIGDALSEIIYRSLHEMD